MLATAITTLLLVSTLTTAKPVPAKRGASIISLPPRSSNNKVFDHAHVRKDIARIKAKYHPATRDKRIAAANARTTTAKRSLKGETAGLYDVHLKRRSGSSGKDPLTDNFDTVDVFYYGPLSIGTPAQETTVDFDTGSSDLVLPLAECSGCAGQLFNSNKSTTFKNSATPFSIQYADQSGAAGTVATDTITVAGLTIVDQGFGAVTNETGGFNHGPNAGLAGLGFPDNAESGAVPFFIGLAKAGGLASHVFSFYMRRGGGLGSELCIGCINSEKYTGDIDYYPLDPSATKGKNLYWNIASTGFSYSDAAANGTTIKTRATATSGFGAVIDSGTTLIYVSPAQAKALYDQIPDAKPAPKDVGEGFFTFPCNATLGEISIGFGGKQYAIDSKDFSLGAASEGSSDCVGGIIGQEVGSDLAIIGDEFMKGWYSVFDYDKMQVGFAKANH